VRVVAIDEYDECFDTAPEAMFVLLSIATRNSASKPQVCVWLVRVQHGLVLLALSKDRSTLQAGPAYEAPGWLKMRVKIKVRNKAK